MIVLLSLRLHNIVLIDSLELFFEKGFTVFTGETGAGKSILLDAVDALLGGTQSNNGMRLLRSGKDCAQIEASFKINKSIARWLKNHEFENQDTEIFISREWRLKDSRLINRCRINGTVVNKNQILSLRPLLIDLTAQGQTHKLALPGQQLNWLDSLGSEALETLRLKVKASWKEWQNANYKLLKAREDAQKYKHEFKELLILLDELETANLENSDEIINLQKEQDRLVNGVSLQSALSLLITYLKLGTDQFPSVLDQLGICFQELQKMIKMDSSLQSLFDKISDINTDLNDLNNELDRYHDLLNSDPVRLDQVQERLIFLQRLEQRYDLSLSQLIIRRNELRESLTLNKVEDSFTDLVSQENSARAVRDSNNKLLSQMRKEIACEFEIALMEHLSPMGLSNIQFKAELMNSNPSENGEDAVQFLFSANPGQALVPLGEVASGGEMSRFLLAFKAILAKVDGSSTLFFDEIDSGMSGRVSKEIANILKDLARDRQVFCVTHQPLIAAAADHHFAVSKNINKGSTRSEVMLLSDFSTRKRELAELAGGDLVEATAYAASLLEQHAA